jgi:hypothetical protein
MEMSQEAPRETGAFFFSILQGLPMYAAEFK